MVTNKHEHELLTVKEAAKMLGVSRWTIYRWLQREWIVGITLPNRQKRILRASIVNLLEISGG